MGSISWNFFDFLGRKQSKEEMEAIFSKLTAELAFKELAYFIGVSYIANTLSKCEFQVFENGEKVKNKLYYRLNVSPNPNENSSRFINKFIENYYYKGHALIFQKGDYIYCADSFNVDTTQPLKGYTFDSIQVGNETLKKKCKSSDVFYYKLDNKNVLNLVNSMYDQYGEIMAYAMKSYKRTNGTKYKLALENTSSGDTKFREQFETYIKGQLKSFIDNDNAVYPQFKGQDLQEFSSKTPQSTSDIISMRKEIFEVTAQALKIPLPMMYGNITNMNEIVKVFLSFCIDPLADMISEETTRGSYTFEEWQKGNYVHVDTSCINHVDILEVAQSIYNAVGSGVVNIDDMRNRLNWQPLNSDFSTQYFLSKNFVPADDMLNGATSDTTTKGGVKDEA